MDHLHNPRFDSWEEIFQRFQGRQAGVIKQDTGSEVEGAGRKQDNRKTKYK